MKNNTTVKNLLGLSQEEAAMVLGVSRGQWSMYEAGKRDLPLSAKEKMTSILSHLQSAKEIATERKKILALEQLKVQEWLEKELRNVAYLKQLLERKRRTIENKRTECFAALDVIRFLETQPKTIPAVLLEDIRTRATAALGKYSLLKLEQLQMKEMHLEMLEKNLDQKIKNTQPG